MGLNFGSIQNMFNPSYADGEFQAKIKGFFIGNTTPELNNPGSMVVWERGSGQGEYYTGTATTTDTIFGAIYAGNSFTVGNVGQKGDFSISKVTIKLKKDGTPPGNIICDIYKTDAAGLPTGSILATGSIVADSITTSAANYEITIDTPAILVYNEQYAYILRLSGDGGDAGNRIHQYINLAWEYTAGKRVRTVDSGANWGATEDSCYFDLQGGGKFLLIKMSDGDTYQAALQKIP